MIQSLIFKRSDGTLVGRVNGLPYHIIEGDPLWQQAQSLAQQMGNALPFEPPPITPPPLPPPVPDDVAVWQFMTAAWRLDFITQQEALAAIKDKVMPPAFAQALGELPAEAQAEAQLKFAGITRMVRADPLFALLVAANKATDAQIDEVFRVAASIT